MHRRLRLPTAAVILHCLLGLVATASCLFSCAKPADEAPAAPAGQRGGVLRLPLSADALTLDPAYIIDMSGRAVARQIYSTLVRFDHNLKLTSDLAETWEVSPDGLRLVFHLKENAKFHNGREVTAEDFVYSFNRLADPKTKSERSILLRDVLGYQEFREGKTNRLSGVSAADKYTLKVELSKPYDAFLQTLATVSFAVVPAEADKAVTGGQSGGLSRNPIGSGPFKLADWQPGSYIRLEANEDFYAGAPYLETVVFKVIPDCEAQFRAYQNGELDASNIPDGKLKEIIRNEELKGQLHHNDLIAIQFYVFNTQREPWKDQLFGSKKALRQALNYAINREYIADELLDGRYKPFVGIIPPALADWYNPANSDEPRYRYDVDEARRLLEVSGHPQGLFLPQKMQLLYNEGSMQPEVAGQVKGFFGDVSVNVEPEPLGTAKFLEKVHKGDYFIAHGNCVAEYPAPDMFLWRLLSSENTGIQGNWAQWHNDEFDALVEQARAELDTGKRRLLYWQAEQIALEEAPWLFLFAETVNVLIKPYVKGIQISSLDADASFPNNDLSHVSIVKTDKD